MSRKSIALALALSLFALAPATYAQEPQPEAEHENTAGEGHEAHHPPPVNWTDFGCGAHPAAGAEKPPPPLIASIINFSLLVALLWWATRRVVNPLLADRRAAIESEIGEAQRLRSEAEAMHREYKERLANMEQEFAALREEFIKSGQAEHQRILDEAKARAERLRKEGEFAVQQEVKQLREDLLRQAVEAAVSTAEGAVTRSIGTQDHGRLADDYLARLEKTPGASA